MRVPECTRSPRGTVWRCARDGVAQRGPSQTPAGYGIKFTADDRDRHFDPAWESVVLEMEGFGRTVIGLSESFWRKCSELRSADVGRWLLDAGAAPWMSGSPPTIAVDPLGEARFAARIVKRRTWGQPRR